MQELIRRSVSDRIALDQKPQPADNLKQKLRNIKQNSKFNNPELNFDLKASKEMALFT